MAQPNVIVQSEDFDAAAEVNKLTVGNFDTGAVVTFTGLCRSEGDSLNALELEHYPGMAEAEILRSAKQACKRWPIDALTVIHRFGVIQPGQQIVLVVATSRHRDAAFDGARYVMDFLKTNAPFWKKEHRVDGEPSSWVDAKESDDAAKKRWQ